MQSDHSIEKTVRLAAGNLHYMLKPFYPTLKTETSDIAERNISFQFAYAFLSWHPQGGAFFEVPYRLGAAQAQHFDFYLHNHELGIVGETKMLTRQIGNPAKRFSDRFKDKQKMSPANVDHMLKTCGAPETNPQQVFRLLLAGAWEEDIMEWWLRGNKEVNDEAFDRSKLLDGMFADGVHVIRYPRTSGRTSTSRKIDTLYLLYAYDIILPDRK